MCFMLEDANRLQRRRAFMQTNNRFFDDLARVASGAASTLAGIRQELDAMVRQRFERMISDFDLVTRDEFEAVKATAANARAEQEALENRVAALEEKLAVDAFSVAEPSESSGPQDSGQSPSDNPS
jgi:BMFP domain-containing protein YqiC